MTSDWGDVVLLLEWTLCWDHEIHIHMSLGGLFARIQDVGMSCYAYWTIHGFMRVINV